MKARLIERPISHLTLAMSAALGTHAHAASLTWDGNGVTLPNPNGGGGGWEAVVSNVNWWDGSGNVSWPATGTDNDAIFGNTAGTVTIAGTGGITLNDLAFNTASYVINGSGITFNGTNPTISNAVAATINAPIGGSVTKTGAGNLSVNTLKAGATLTISQGTVFGNAGAGIKGNLQINSGATFSSSTPHIFERPAARVHINGGTFTNANEFYNSAGTSAADPGIQMTGGTWSGSDQRFDSGALAHIRINPASTTATLSAMLRHYQTGTQTYNVVGGTVPNGVDLLCTGSLGGNFNATGPTHITKTGAGLMEFTGTPVLHNNGNLTLSAGTLRLTGTNAITNFGTASSSLVLDAATPVTLQLNAANTTDTLTFSKGISGGSANATVTKTGPGSVTLTGTKSYTGNTTVAGGRLYQNATFTTPPVVSVAGSGVLGGTSAVGNVTVAHGGTLEGGQNGSGTLTAAHVTIGSVAADAAVLKGTVAAGTAPLAVANLTLNGGDQMLTLSVAGTGLTNGSTYDVLVSANPITAPNASSVLAALKSGSRAFTVGVDVTGTRIQVTYNDPDGVYWTGANGPSWDTTAPNWKLSTSNADTQYLSGDGVSFHDSPASDVVDISSGDVAPGSVTFDNTATTYTVTGTNGITGATAVGVTGGGKVILANPNSYTGATTIGSASSLQLGNGSANGSLGTGSAITNNGTLAIANGNGDQSQGTHFSGSAIGGTGTLYKTGTSKLTLTAANTFSQAIVSQGTLQLNHATGAGSAVTLGDADTGDNDAVLVTTVSTGTPVTASAANTGTGITRIQQSTNYTSLSGPLTLNRATTIQASGSDRSGIQGKISGNVGTLTFTGSRVTMEQSAENASDFTGDVTIAGATLQMNSIHGLPATAGVDVQSGTFRILSGAVIDGLSGSGTVHNDSGGGAAVAPLSLGNSGGDGVFQGTLRNGTASDIVHLIKNGAGTQEFMGANINYTGATTLNEGTLVLSDTPSFASSGIAMSNTNPVKLTLNQAMGSKTFANVTGGATATAQIEKNGMGTVVLTGSDFAGSAADAILVNEGILFVNSPVTAAATVSGTLGGTGTVGNVVVNDGGTLTGGYSGTGSLAMGNLTIGSAASDEATISGTLAPASTPINAQAVTLNGGNGSVLINAAGSGLTNGSYYDVLSYTSISAPHASSPQAVFKTTSRAYSPSVDTVAKKVKLYYDANQGIYWTGIGSTEWSTLSGMNNWKLSGTNAVTDFLSNDVVIFDNRATDTTVLITEDVSPIGTTIDNDAAHPYLIDGPVFGIATGALVKKGVGTAVISSWNTYGGGTTISGGVLEAAVPEALGSSGVIAMDGGTLRFAGINNADYSTRLRIHDDKLAVFDTNGQNVNFNSAMTTGVLGSGGMKKTGAGTLALGNAAGINNSYSGGTTISGGTLRLNGGSDGYCAGTGTITLGDSDTPAEGAALAVQGATWGANGPDRWVQNPIAVGATSPGSGPLVISRPAGVHAATIKGEISLANDVTFLNSSGDRLAIEGKITGTGNVTVEGSQRVNFDYTGNDYLGTTTVAAVGTLQVNRDNVVPATSDVIVNGILGFNSDQATALAIASLAGHGSVDVPYGSGNPVLTVGADGAAHNADFAGIIQSRIALTKAGDSTQVLSGANIYTGPTLVEGGALVVNGSIAAGSAVTVGEGGTLGGAGSIHGATVVNGTLAPGASVGTLTFGSTIYLSASSNCAMEITGAATHDKILATAAGLETHGTITVTLGSYVPVANTVFDLVDGTVAGGPTFAFSDTAAASWDTSLFLVDGTIRYIGEVSGFDGWAATHAPGQTMEEDHDHDGVSNGIEYFMGASGSGFTALPGPVGLTMTWPMAATYAGSYDAGYVVETSPSLATGSWTPVPLGQVTITPGSSVKYTLPGGQGKVFARLKVTGP